MNEKHICSYCETSTRWARALRDGRFVCRGCEVCLFFENYLYLTGDFVGQPFKLMPWLRQVVRDVFGTLDDEGLRQYKDVYLEVPTGNAKTTFCAGLVLYFLCCHKATGTEVYSAATAKDQAAITFRMAHQMAIQSPLVSKLVRVIPSTKRIVRRDDPTSFYAAISADGDVHDGMNPQFVVRDELHRWRTRKHLELNEVLERKIVKRHNPLIWDITTAGEGEDESPLCWRRHEYARQIAEGSIKDPRFYGYIWSADPKRIEEEPDYWKSREARVAANPSHEDNGGYLKDAVLADLCLKAQNDPLAKADYLRYHLNIWGRHDEAVIDMAKWVCCDGGVDLQKWPLYDVDLLIRKWGLIDRPCIAGVDAAWTTDLAALSLLFLPDDDFPWTLLSFVWVPQDRVHELKHKTRMPFDNWVERGFVEAVPGAVVETEPIVSKVRWAAEMFELREVAYDPWNFRRAASQMIDEGFQAVEVRQGYASLSEATKKLLEIYQGGNFRHGNNPVLNWCASCLTLLSDNKDNVQPKKPERAKSSKRIDCISATITALSRAIAHEDSATEISVRMIG